MSPRLGARTAPCDRSQARVRLAQARKYLEVGDVIATEDDDASATVTFGLAVLAGIAAADAACCAALGMRPRGQDHQQATGLVARIGPGGAAAAAWLSELLALAG